MLASTYKSEELEMILRDLDEIAQTSGLELFKSEPISKLKTKISHEDRISSQMFKTKTELNSIKSLEEERQFKNLIEKLSIVELSTRLQDLLHDIEDITAHEKKLLTNQIVQYKEVMADKEKRMNGEIKTLRKERQDLLVKLGTLDLADENDKLKVKQVLDGLSSEQDERVSILNNENKKLHTYATQMTKILDGATGKQPVKLQDQGRYKGVDSDTKSKGKKSQYLNISSNRSDISINNTVRKSANKPARVAHSQGWK